MTKQKLPKGIRKKSSGKYITDVCVNGIRKTSTSETLAEALKSQILLRTELEQYGSVAEMRESLAKQAEVWTLEHACDYCRETRWSRVRNKKSIETKINTMLKFFGNGEVLENITTRRVDDFYRFLISKYKPGTVNLYLAGLSSVLRMAFDREMITKLPKISRAKDTAKRVRYLTDEEEAAILKYFEKDIEMREIFIVLIDTGMRRNELLGLKRDNIDTEHGIINIWKTKTDKPRSIPMTGRVLGIIKERLSVDRQMSLRRYERSDKLFNVTKAFVHYRWDKMRGSLGYQDDPDFVLHMLRHTCCSRLVQRGADLMKVMKWMGHSNISTTMIYAHLSPNALLDIKDLLEIR